MRINTPDPRAPTLRLQVTYRELTENPESLSALCGTIAGIRAQLGNTCPELIVSIVPEAAEPAPWTAADQERFERDFECFQRWASGEAAPDEVLPWEEPEDQAQYSASLPPLEALTAADLDPAALAGDGKRRADRPAVFRKYPELENYVPPLYRAVNEGLELIRDLRLAPANEIPDELTDVHALDRLFQKALRFAKAKSPKAEDGHTLNLPLLAARKRLWEISDLLLDECAKTDPFAKQIQEIRDAWRKIEKRAGLN